MTLHLESSIAVPPRIVVVNPNSSVACTRVIETALAGLGRPGGPWFDCRTLAEGPAAITTWRDWHMVSEPLARFVEREDAGAETGEVAPAAYVVACVSDPAIDLLRATTRRPVMGALRAGIGAALARADRFGLVAFVRPSVERQMRVMQAMGVEARCVGSVPLDLPMEALVDATAPRARLAEVGRSLRAMGAGTIVLGCAGMAGHRRFLEEETGVPVVEPIQAAGALALLGCL